ncbi:BICD family-like cargo adapter 1 isoform X2 [Rhinatrema bivittatum]|uniref:BICD family-like cargo adapter 1 isoform X2 n=1 Tax=Rhinatrema bivittatum TaxID=194408 RepID=UPI0011284E02|nr:BICD family-like cargo adapter 1 isoform X2 [Rhinatrema bivittatum]
MADKGDSLTQKKLDLRGQVSSLLQEKERLQQERTILSTQLSALEIQNWEQQQELCKSWSRAEDVQMLNQKLQEELKELREESRTRNNVLLSENKRSWDKERHQVAAEIQRLCQELGSSERALSLPVVSVALSQLRDLAGRISSPQSEDRTPPCQTCLTMQQSVAGYQAVVGELQAENLHLKAENQQRKVEARQVLQQALQERDDAIAKKMAVEQELNCCKLELKSLTSQLLESVQRKVKLSQELEAWQDDMGRVISEQLQSQEHKEGRPTRDLQETPKSHPTFLRRSKPQSAQRKGFFSFLRF